MNALPKAPSPSLPPLLERRAAPAQRANRWPVIAFAGCLLALGGLRLAVAWQWPLPGCRFHAVTGLPCMSCGSTRAALALTHGEWLEAMRLNPLACLAFLAVATAFLLWCADASFGSRLLSTARQWLSRLPGWRLFAVAVALNWAYLILSGGR